MVYIHEKQYGLKENSRNKLAMNQILVDLIKAGEKKLV